MKDFELRYVGSHVEVWCVPVFSRYGAGGHGGAGRVSGDILRPEKAQCKIYVK